MQPPFAQPRVQFAIDVVRKAAQLVRRVQQEMISSALAKVDHSPVTVADFAAQGMVAKLLSEQFPEDFLVGEESSAMLREDDGREILEQITHFVQNHCPGATPAAVCDWIDRGTGDPPSAYWTLDPVDGTKGFLRGDQYAVALAYVKNGVVQIGVLGCPELVDAHQPATGGSGSLVVAVRGAGTLTQSIDGPSLSGQTVDKGVLWKSLKVSQRCDVSTTRLTAKVRP